MYNFLDEELLNDIREMKDSADETYSLTPWGCLYSVLLDYGIELNISGRVGAMIIEDFMDLMAKQGHIRAVEDNK